MNVMWTATVARTPSVKWSTKGNNAPVQLHSFQTQPQLLVASRSPNIAPLTASAKMAFNRTTGRSVNL